MLLGNLPFRREQPETQRCAAPSDYRPTGHAFDLKVEGAVTAAPTHSRSKEEGDGAWMRSLPPPDGTSGDWEEADGPGAFGRPYALERKRTENDRPSRALNDRPGTPGEEEKIYEVDRGAELGAGWK
jgi:hypothetical protein